MNGPRLCCDNQLDRRIAKGCTVARLTSLRFFFFAHSAFGGSFLSVLGLGMMAVSKVEKIRVLKVGRVVP